MATEIKGLSKLQKKLNALPKIVKDSVQIAMASSAEETISMMKSHVPRDSEALYKSIGWTWGEAPKGSISASKLKASRAGDGWTVTIYAGNTEAFYARWVEFGTKGHIQGGKFAGAEHPGTRAQPFFFNSVRANRKTTKASIRKAVRTAAKKVAAS